MSGNHSRNKGYRFEAEFVNYMRGGAVPTERHFMSGLYEKGDCTLSPTRLPTPLKGELKRRKCLPTWLTAALGNHDFVAMREDRGETFILLRASLFRTLLASADEDEASNGVTAPCIGREG